MQDQGIVYEQFNTVHPRKNILFVSPMLSGRHLYRYLLPYLELSKYDKAATALTGLVKYGESRYEDIDIQFGSREILWADIIVFPFTTQPMTELFNRIREINPKVKLFYNIDFNYYLMHESHPFHAHISQSQVTLDIEDNVIASDVTLFTNQTLLEFVKNRIDQAVKDRYDDKPVLTSYQTQALLTDIDIVTENQQGQVLVEPDGTLRIGIVCQDYHWKDIHAWSKQMHTVQEKHGDKVRFVFIGFNGVNAENKSCVPPDFKFEYVPKSSIVHYFKELSALSLDAIFIPLVRNAYNETSEGYNRFLEASVLKIPVIVPDVAPYNTLDENPGDFMFLLKKKEDLLLLVKEFIKDRTRLKQMGEKAYQEVYEKFTYHDANIVLLDRIYS
jgi:glycosyltransferase involved in cell wall biosynthesis